MRLRAFLVAAGIATLAAAAPAHAATFTVSGTADGAGSCTGSSCTTVRAAVTEAARLTGSDTIKLDALTYNVSGELTLGSALTIAGASAATTEIRGDGKSGRVLSIGAGQSVTLAHATISNGVAQSTAGDMGGNVLVNQGAVLTADHVRITGGTAYRGGGLAIAGGGQAKIANSLIDHNQAVNSAAGGGGGDGGGILSQGNAKAAAGSVLSLTDSTVTANSALASAGIVSRDDPRNRTTLTRVTVAGNFAGSTSGGPGIFVSDAESFAVSSSIVSGNTGDGVQVNCGGKLTSGGGNIDSGSSCGLATPADKQSTDPQLGPLLAAGGETPVLAIAATSPAVDFGAPCTGTDQRDLPRPDGKSCDSGAYERDLPPPAPVITTPPTDVPQRSSTVNLAGTAQPGARVEVLEGGTSRGAVTATGGNWSLQLTGVADGAHTYSARATDGGGTGAASADRTVTVDTKVPGAPAITVPSGDVLQKTSTVNLAGTAEANASVEVLDGTASKGTVAASATGAWSVTLTGVADGAHPYTARATDAAGNTGPASSSRTIAVDTMPPAADVTGGPDGPTTDPSPAFTFASELAAITECKLDGPGAAVGSYRPCASPESFSGLAPGAYVFWVRATDAAGNQSEQTRSFSVALVQQAPTPTPSATPTPTPSPTPTPVPNKTVVIQPVSGKTLVLLPGSKKFEPVDITRGIPVGSTVDTRKSRIRLYAIPKPGMPAESALFYDGIFKVTQSGGITELQLVEQLAACPKGKTASAAAKKKPKARKLWGDGTGSFRTRGQYSSATVRGTKWLVQDSCGKTLTRVARGVVSVQDFVRHKTILVRAPKSYTANKKP
ncbi:Ig-like domain-containing protein [Candidatus Solirubrobacter pratensis]|uniref:Ig-like domain-containing protein n=1 Tax=Candidatus Solirubrobacter pratensis TaxID=1298857 RepID=UPI00056D80FE|nr:Ig-like domain-containing protein [Candidatus Solirubrobacter pratensis]